MSAPPAPLRSPAAPPAGPQAAPQTAPRPRDLVLLAATALALGAVLGRHRLLSLSVDVAYHLQELEVVRDRWLIPASAQPWLSELWWYPKLSHRAAAALTRFGLNDIDALTTLAVLSAAAAWASLLGWARRAGWVVLAGGTALALAFGYGLGAWLGGEAVDNFFFPQIVGEAAAWLTLGALAAWAWDRPWLFMAGGTAAVGLCGCIHALPTLNLAAAFMALFAQRLGRAWLRERRVSAADAAGVFAAPAAAVLNPFFGAMRWIAGNDGGISLTRTLSYPLLGGAAALLLGLCAAVLVLRLFDPRRDGEPGGRAAEVLAAMGAGVAATALLQLAAFLVLHDGSAYAVRKHGFDVFTLLAFVLPLAGLSAWRRAPGGMRRPAPAWTAAVALVGVTAAVFLHPSKVDVPGAARLMADVRRLRPADGAHDASVLFASDTTPPMLAYMADIAMLQARHDDLSTLNTVFTGQPGRAETAGRLVTRVGDAYDRPGCRTGPPVGGVVAVHAACAAFPSVSFAAGEAGAAYLVSGWSSPEIGVWSDGPHAVVDLPLPDASRTWRGAWIYVECFAFLPDRSPSRTVTLKADGAPVETFTFRAGVARDHGFAVRLDRAALARGRVRLEFDIADPVTPAELGLGADPRRLGVGLARVAVLPDNRS